MTAALTMPVLADHDPADGPAVAPTAQDFPGGGPNCPEGTIGIRFGDSQEDDGPLTEGAEVTVTFADLSEATVKLLSLADDKLTFEVDGGLAAIVYVKGGANNTQNVYNYTGLPGGGIAHDDGLVTPAEQGISHIDFCIVQSPPEEELSASLTIAKAAEGDEGEEFAIGDEMLADGESFTLTFETEDFTEGEVVAIVTEVLSEAQDEALWSLTDIACDGATFDVDLEAGSVTVTLHDGDDVTCTFENTQDNEGTEGGNPPPPGGTAGGNPPPDTAMGEPISGNTAAVTALVMISLLAGLAALQRAQARRRS